jgi:hypothetical protein
MQQQLPREITNPLQTIWTEIGSRGGKNPMKTCPIALDPLLQQPHIQRITKTITLVVLPNSTASTPKYNYFPRHQHTYRTESNMVTKTLTISTNRQTRLILTMLTHQNPINHSRVSQTPTAQTAQQGKHGKHMGTSFALKCIHTNHLQYKKIPYSIPIAQQQNGKNDNQMETTI